MSWLFSQALVEAYSLENCSDGILNVQLSVMPTPQMFWCKDKMMDFSRLFQFGLTCQVLTENRGQELLTWFLEDSRVKILASVGQAQELKAREVDFGGKWRESFAKLDPILSSWKTAQCSLIEDSEPSLETWPEWGLMQGGECFELPPLERATIDQGFTWLLTPTAQSWKAWTFRNPLALIRKNHADGNLQEQLMRLYQRMTTPLCQEILMIWPDRWTDLKPLGMAGFQQWRQEQYECLGVPCDEF